jgi:hypothetical protein
VTHFKLDAKWIDDTGFQILASATLAAQKRHPKNPVVSVEQLGSF